MSTVRSGSSDASCPALAARRDTAWQDLEAGRIDDPVAAVRFAARFVAACRESDTSIPRSLFGLARYRARGRWIWAHQHTRIRGIRNLETKGLLKIGIDYADISHPGDRTSLRIDGRMAVGPRCKIGRGSRIHVARGAEIRWDEGVWTNANVLIHIANGLEVGRDCLIGWGAQLVDDDFHHVEYDGRPSLSTGAPITIGSHVLISNRASIGKGVAIADGCVVASNSVVTHSVEEPNCLVAGAPARIVRRGIRWH